MSGPKVEENDIVVYKVKQQSQTPTHIYRGVVTKVWRSHLAPTYQYTMLTQDSRKHDISGRQIIFTIKYDFDSSVERLLGL